MLNRLARRPLGLIGSLAVALLIFTDRPSNARPLYKKCFDTVVKTMFPKFETRKSSCTVCHDGDSKKKLNHFGKALAEELGESNVRDEEKIIAAIKAVLKRKCKSGDWGDRLEHGLVPCECNDSEADSYVARQLLRGY